MKNPAVFYAVIALGVVVLIAGVYMLVGMHFHGKAYAVIALGVVCLAAGISAIFVTKSKAATAK
ncbi:MAG: hypothetical protein JO125_00860 [Chloroflexi bacterium]|nr:hypothetical protein [Ktedonobacteraceae bacterium]MBV9021337.1 hypothetical protein [Ktedonobacteraceae bacterium]MBV9705939.1 hypothetical protein [Chloroflexota bacterium]